MSATTRRTPADSDAADAAPGAVDIAAAPGAVDIAEAQRFCGCCLVACSWSDFPAHLLSPQHRMNVSLYREAVNVLFDKADEILQLCGGRWERCFHCASEVAHTVVSFACSYCDGAGDRTPAQGVPGVPFNNGTFCNRFLCRECAKFPFCRSCSSAYGRDNLFLDADAVQVAAASGALSVPHYTASPPMAVACDSSLPLAQPLAGAFDGLFDDIACPATTNLHDATTSGVLMRNTRDGDDDRSDLSAFWRIGPGRVWHRPGLRFVSVAPSRDEGTPPPRPETRVFPDGGDRADLSDFWRVGPGRRWTLPDSLL